MARGIGVDLALLCEATANVEPHLGADGTRIWSLMQLERQLRPKSTADGEAATSTVDGRGSSTYTLSIGPTRTTDTSSNREGKRLRLAAGGASGFRSFFT